MNKNNQKPRLIACDYDRTLSYGRNRITQRTKSALRLAHENGAILALVTGRPFSMVPAEIKDLPFDFLITTNGARINDLSTPQNNKVSALDKDIVLSIFDAVDTITALNSISMGVFLDGHAIFNPRLMKLHAQHTQMSFFQKLFGFFLHLKYFISPHDFRRIVKRTPKSIEKLGFYFNNQEECQEALKAIRQLGAEGIITENNNVEVTAKDVSKGYALTIICKNLSIPKEAVIAFGDSGNDLSMVDVVGRFLAPANAIPEVLAAATHVIPSVAEDGVAQFLECLYQREKLETADFINANVPVE